MLNLSNYLSGGPFDLIKVTSYTPGTPMTLTGVKATAYDTTTNTWTFDSTSLSFTSFEKAPHVGEIYAATGASLIGDPIEIPIPLSGMVFYAPLESAAATAETGQTLTISGSVSYSDGAMVFSGDGRLYFDIGSSASTGSGPATLSIWYKGTDSGSDQFLMGYGSTPFSNTALCLRVSNGVVYATSWAGGDTGNTSYPINDGVWHHIAATYANNLVVVYIDGEEVASGYCAVNIGGTEGGVAGAFWGDYSRMSGSFKAARIYNRFLSAQEINKLYNEFSSTFVPYVPAAVPSDDLTLGNWTWRGNPTVTGNIITWNGQDNGAYVSNSETLDACTVSLWVNDLNLSAAQDQSVVPFYIGGTTGTNDCMLCWWYNSSLRYGSGSNNGGGKIIDGTYTYSFPVHIAIVRSDGVLALYLNGKPAKADSWNISFTASNICINCAYDNGSIFSNTVSFRQTFPRIYQRKLSYEEIVALANDAPDWGVPAHN